MDIDVGELYGTGARQLQDTFDSRRLADRLTEIIINDFIDERTRASFEAASYFFLATVDPDGFPDVSYKGGRPGFVQVIDDNTLRFPSYDGNGMYRSLGNIVDTPNIGMLFIGQDNHPFRIRVHGRARVLTDEAAVDAFVGAEAVVEVSVGRTFINCPRYVHDISSGELSPNAPAPDYEPPQPDWKQWDLFADVLPGTSPAGDGNGEDQ
ncbi:MAG: pyridoxamine 5'-phosphate oxidase family protein [Actinomycetia bacterium]|nr:pyridoxamine 5'-phosphate oxidase family protein [Actinomycetes bacterium]MCP5035667.1 pyridoxamine 5'-phosphate oxidase family protein [Actinomycetes bacterium]